jgi:hypothetical protein
MILQINKSWRKKKKHLKNVFKFLFLYCLKFAIEVFLVLEQPKKHKKHSPTLHSCFFYVLDLMILNTHIVIKILKIMYNYINIIKLSLITYLLACLIFMSVKTKNCLLLVVV